MMSPTDVTSVGEVNDEGVPLDMTVNTRLSRVCGLATRQRVSITLQGFDDLTKNEKDELFKNSIQAYVQYLKELKQKWKKVAMKIVSHAWKSYKSKLVKIWRDQDTFLYVQRFDKRILGDICGKVRIRAVYCRESVHAVAPITE
jgi:hypothetical protein